MPYIPPKQTISHGEKFEIKKKYELIFKMIYLFIASEWKKSMLLFLGFEFKKIIPKWDGLIKF
jgi:hypothetical protein